MSDKLSIIVPVYFNQDTLLMMFNDLEKEVFSVIENYEVVFVDDGSLDDSWSIIQSIVKKNERVKAIKLSKNFGSHSAIFAGLSICTGDCAVVKAADMQEQSSIIIDMYDSWKQGNKVVLAIRKDREDVSLFSDFYYFLVRKFALKNMPKKGFDIYLVDRKVIEVLKLLDERNSALTLQILWCGFKTAEINYVRKNRTAGHSRWTLRKKIKLVVDSIISFSFIPIRAMSALGFLSFVFSIIWMIYVLVAKMMGNIPIEGFTTLTILILFFSGGIMLTLGILGEYIWRTLDASRNRPVFIIEEQTGKDNNEQ
ncbi:MAG: glycosyltransferase family 2 protein [Erysipelotrichales bacterium]|nr:glycosyltransferase family 2 protein [Erysipelotrichales bacterium]